MAEAKTFVFGQDSNNSNNMLGFLAPLLQQRGLDPNMVMAMMNNKGDYNTGGWFMWILFILIIFAFTGNGFGNRNNGNDAAYLSNLISNDNGRDLLMQAIQGNNTAITQLATTLNCSIGQIQQGINALMNQTQQVGNQVGQSGLQVINAIQAGNATLASQIATACCNNQLAICQQTNTLQQSINNVATGQERGFSQLGFTTQQQTCDLKDAIRENTQTVVAGQRAAEMRELQREIAERDRKITEQATVINNGQQTAIFSQMIQQATNPIAVAVAGVKSDIDSIKCKLPETATIPYSPVVGVPTVLAAQYGLYNAGLATGIWG